MDLTLSDAFRLLLSRVVREKALPFDQTPSDCSSCIKFDRFA